jgi:release factor glutamine methyltransferase
MGEILRKTTGRGVLDAVLAGDSFTPAEAAAVERAVGRRLEGEPLAYITGEAAFLNFTLAVAEGTFIPRPETELLVLAAAEFLLAEGGPAPRALDLGAGSGNIEAGLCLRVPGLAMDAVERLDGSVETLRKNLERFHLQERVRVIKMDYLREGLAGLPGPYDLVVANPPYVPAGEWEGLAEEVRREPRGALIGGPAGDEVLKWILAQAPARLKRGGALAVEIGIGQSEGLAEEAARLPGLALEKVLDDFRGIPRVMVFRKAD